MPPKQAVKEKAAAAPKRKRAPAKKKKGGGTGEAHVEEDEDEQGQPGPATPAASAGPSSGSGIPSSHITITFPPGYMEGSPRKLPAVPDLIQFPEKLTNAQLKAELASTKSLCWKYDLLLNYGFLPMNEIYNKDGTALRLPWWDEKPDALAMVQHESRAPTKDEVKNNANFIGKKYAGVTLFYPLISTGLANEPLGEVLGLQEVRYVYMHQTCVAYKFFGPLCRAKLLKFWGHEHTQADAFKQYTELVEGFSNAKMRSICRGVLEDEKEPLQLIRNGDIGLSQPEKINVNATANMAVLKYLAHCPTGLFPDAEGTKRYTRYKPSKDKLWGFSFDDMFRGVSSYIACLRQRFASNMTSTKKAGGLDSIKMPMLGKSRINYYTRATAAQYSRFLEDDSNDIPENLAAQSVVTIAEEFRRLQSKLPRDTDLEKTGELYERLWRRTGFLAMTAKYNRINRAAASIARAGKGNRRLEMLDAMDNIPPIDCRSVLALVNEIYNRGLLARPTVTMIENELVYETFQALLTDTISIEQYMATRERDGDLLEEAVSGCLVDTEQTARMRAEGVPAAEIYRQQLVECHALLGLLPARLPAEVTFVEALKGLSMYAEGMEGNEKYTDLRLCWDLDEEGKASTHVFALRIMVKSAMQGALLANKVGTGKTLVFMAERYEFIKERLRSLDKHGFDEDNDCSSELPSTIPTMLIAPANLVEQHFNEISRYFPADTFKAEMEVAVVQAKTSLNMRKIWIFLYSTTVFRLLRKEWGMTYVIDKTRLPYDHGIWELDTHDISPSYDEGQITLICKTVEAAYSGSVYPLPVPPTDLEQAAMADTDNAAPGPAEEGGRAAAEADVAEVREVPTSVCNRLLKEWLEAGNPTMRDVDGKQVQMQPRFYRRYCMTRFPEGFYFQHIILDECYTVCNYNTGWSRAVRWEWWSLMLTHRYRDETRDLVRKILKCLGMRRGMNTITYLPDYADGTPWLVCPGDGIPPHYVETYEVGHTILKPAVDQCMNQHFRNLAIGEDEDAGTHEYMVTLPGTGGISQQETKVVEVVVDTTDKDDDDTGARLDGGLLRVLIIASICWLSYEAMTCEDYVGACSEEDAMMDLVAADEAGDSESAKRAKARETTAQRVRGQDGGPVTFGAEHTEAVLQGTGDSGLSYLQLLGYGDNPFDFIPTERKAVLSRVLCKSPINTCVLEIVAQRAAKGERTLVMVATLWEQLLLVAILEKACLSVVSIRAVMTAAEKSAAIAKFNDPGSNLNVMVLNQRCGSAGLNLHYCCNYGIQLQYPWNFGTAELQFPEWLEEYSGLRTLVAYDVLRVMWSQPFNRFTWEKIYPVDIQDFNSVETRMFGKFYRLLSRFLLSIDPSEIDKEDLYSLLAGLDRFLDVLPFVYAEICEKEGTSDDDELSFEYLRDMIASCQDEWVSKKRKGFATHEFGSVSKKRKVVDHVAEEAKREEKAEKAEKARKARAAKKKKKEAAAEVATETSEYQPDESSSTSSDSAGPPSPTPTGTSLSAPDSLENLCAVFFVSSYLSPHKGAGEAHNLGRLDTQSMLSLYWP
ncbi:hypothetical protein M406DRAFT_71392 [Cryphonectria parasitica EP155]|uniref:Helicase ATP-binding domain-containing protein n=1 Tax=Cryphonectria parasitica (strain ATCC 38755 / EP155) TaxID=660469 RepID=A0A9P4Y7E7_CRYP1|nr:uncharacterized protein M406DRAFT_71392 [Cryphonectria parasitica EP155]KAF3768339.1 hypothetical protein M406DRAFT_71392 [Cryphonectria parasitica EP155]